MENQTDYDGLRVTGSYVMILFEIQKLHDVKLKEMLNGGR
jgi:hypothetical protein